MRDEVEGEPEENKVDMSVEYVVLDYQNHENHHCKKCVPWNKNIIIHAVSYIRERVTFSGFHAFCYIRERATFRFSMREV
jgi:hypothetical protein